MGRVSDARQRLMNAVLELIWTGSYGSTTIDQICEKAEVKKGSFYYFFNSKAELAAAALEADWEVRRGQLDSIFSPTIPPLERLRTFCEMPYQKQLDLKQRYGAVLGCPIATLGSEVCTQEHNLRAKIQEIMGSYRKYLESLIRDAHAAGVVTARDPAEKARMVWAYYEGLMTQARIQNDVEVLRELPRSVFAMLGVREAQTVTA
jgi:TetR/AcrR family transcriptional regulator, transcriptional repressor for nem operon